jgi:hypothetical protein
MRNSTRWLTVVLGVILLLAGFSWLGWELGRRGVPAVVPKSTTEPKQLPVIPTATLLPPTQTPTAIPKPDCVSPLGQLQIAPRAFGDYPAEIEAYLNAGGDLDDLSNELYDLGVANLPLTVLTGEMTGDGAREVVVSIFDPQSTNSPPSGVLLIYVCRGSRYELALNESTPDFEGGPVLWQLADLDGDGKDDLVYSLTSCGAHSCFDRLQILSWDGEAFIQRVQGDSNDLPYPEIQIDDPDGDGIYQLLVIGTGYGSIGAGPQRSMSRLWEYNASTGYWEPGEDVLAPSPYRIHVLHDADRALRLGQDDKALSLYRQVVENDDLLDWMDAESERAALGAYALFKVMVLFTMQGDVDGAQDTYQTLEQWAETYAQYPSAGAYRDMAAAFLQEVAGGGYANACAEARSYAVAQSKTILRPLGSEVFGYANPDITSEDICP